MSLGPGARLGPYEVVAAIGAGGMGEVYRARDTRLDRTVAIKILPSAVARDPTFRERFDREARAVAALNHPHICTLYDIGEEHGTAFLVMEYLEGETLADRLAKGALPIDQALRYAIQIAEALDKAHRAGIIHRDLKPGNIMICRSGPSGPPVAKLLDFGLAKAAPVATISSMSILPTAHSPVTAQGTILGTLQYMAPEQVEGREADARSDIFAFGAIVYEMVTGKRAFDGKSQASVIASILDREPPAMSSLQPVTPPLLDHVVQRCVAKEPGDRWQTIGDVAKELAWTTANAGASMLKATGHGASLRGHPLLRTALIVVAASAIAAVATFRVITSEPPPPLAVVRLALTTPPALPLTPFGFDRDIASSSDGSFVVYRAGGLGELAVRKFDRLDATALGVIGARQPVISPDGRWVAFVDEISFVLKKVPLSGGAPISISRLPLSPRGLVWLDNQTLIATASNPMYGLLRVSANGGDPTTLTSPDRAHGELGHWWPSVLPGARTVLYTIAADRLENDQIALLDLDTGRSSVLIRGGSDAQYVRSGHLLYASGNSLYAVPFDVSRRVVTGPAVRVVDGVAVSSLGAANAMVTPTGMLVYLPNTSGNPTPRSLVWVNRSGVETPIPAPARAYISVRLSPDDSRIAVNTYDEQSDVWVWDLIRQSLTRLTFDPAIDLNPIWTPDGKQILFSSNRAGAYNPYLRAADGTGTDVRVGASEDATYPRSVTPDGSSVVGEQLRGRTGYDLVRIAIADLHHSEKSTPQPLLATAASESAPEISPDGHFVAYQSDESGRLEIYVRSYPEVSNGRWQVSTTGGRTPAWTRNGKELLFLDATGHLSSATVEEAGGTLRLGTPTILLHTTYTMADAYRAYDVSSDGARFLMIKEGAGGVVQPQSLVVVQHFDEEVKRLAPAQ